MRTGLMSAMGRKQTLADPVNYPSTRALGIYLTLAITPGADHADAAWHLNRAFYPVTSVALYVGVTFVAPRIA